MEEPRELVEARHRQILGDRQDCDESVALPVLGNERKATRDPAANVPLTHKLSLNIEAA